MEGDANKKRSPEAGTAVDQSSPSTFDFDIYAQGVATPQHQQITESPVAAGVVGGYGYSFDYTSSEVDPGSYPEESTVRNQGGQAIEEQVAPGVVGGYGLSFDYSNRAQEEIYGRDVASYQVQQPSEAPTAAGVVGGYGYAFDYSNNQALASIPAAPSSDPKFGDEREYGYHAKEVLGDEVSEDSKSSAASQRHLAGDGSSGKYSKRYCGGRLNRWQFYLMVAIIMLACFVGLVLAVGYLIILPTFIPKIFWSLIFEGNWDKLTLQDFRINEVTPNGINTRLYLDTRSVKLPVSWAYAELQSTTFTFYTYDNKREFFTLQTEDPLNLNGKEPLKFRLDPFFILFNDPENARDVVHAFVDLITGSNSTGNAIADPPFKIYVEAKGDVWVCGLPVYKVDFYRYQELDFTGLYNWIGRNVLGGLLGLLDTKAYNTYMGALGGVEFPNSTVVGVPSPNQQQVTVPSPDQPAVVQNLSVGIDSSGLRSKAIGYFQVRQPTTISVGTFQISLLINSATLAYVRVNGIDLAIDKREFEIMLEVAPVPVGEGDLGGLEKAVEQLTKGRLEGITAGINGVFLRAANETAIGWLDTILDGVDFEIDIDRFQRLFMSLTDPGGLLNTVGSTITLDSLNILTHPNNTIDINPILHFSNFINFDIDLTPFTAVISSDAGVPLITALVPEIKLKGPGDLWTGPRLRLVLQDSEEAAVAAGKVVSTALLAVPSYFALGQISFNPRYIADPSGVQRNRTINEMAGLNRLFSILRVRVPLTKLFFNQIALPLFTLDSARPKTPGAGGAARPGAPARKLHKRAPGDPLLGLTLDYAELNATERGLTLRADTSISSSLPIFADLPFVALRVGLADGDFVRLVITGLGISNVTKTLQIGVDLSFSPDERVPGRAADLVNAVLNGSIPTTDLVVQGLRLGPSEANSYGLFDRLNLTVPGIAWGLLRNILNPNQTDSTMPMPTPTPTPSPTPAPTVTPGPAPIRATVPGLDQLTLDAIAPRIDSVDVTATVAHTLAVGVGLSLNNPLPVRVTIPYIGVDLLLDDEQVVRVSLEGPNGIGPGANTNVPATIRAVFNPDADAVPKKVAALVNSFLGNGGAEGRPSISVKGITFGRAQNASVQALRELQIPIPLGDGSTSTLTPSSSDSSSSLSIGQFLPAFTNANLTALWPTIRSADIATAPGATLTLAAGLSLQNPIPLTVDIPFIAIDLTLDSTRALSVTLTGLKLVRGANEAINIALRAQFNNEGDVSAKVAMLVRDLLNGAKGSVALAVRGIRLGPNTETAINTLKEISIPIPINGGNSITVPWGVVAPWASGLGLNSFDPALGGVDLQTTVDGLAVSAGLGIANPTPITLRAGYIALDITLDGVRFFTAVLEKGINIGRGRTADLRLDVAILFNRSPALTGRVSALVDAVLKGGVG
ncbi:hypothetical protein HK102_005822, partial [Quaeritorhiza haematococci]